MKKESALQRNSETVVEAKMSIQDFSKILPKKKFRLLSKPSLDQDPRYDEALARRIPKLPVISVLVKRPLPYKPPVEVVKPFTLGLQLAVDEKKQPLTLYEPFSGFTRRKLEISQQPWCQNATSRRELAKQELALHAWEDRLKSVTRETAWLSKKIGRPTAELLFSTPLILPPPENHRGRSRGPKHDFPKVKDQERFYRSDAFFWMPHRVGPAEFSIDSTPTWTERKFYKPPLTIARPRLDDMLPSSLRNVKRYQDQKRALAHLEKIVVKGAALDMVPGGLPHPSLVTFSPDDDQKKTEEKNPPHEASSDSLDSSACLMVEGTMYHWGEQCPQDLVEVGFVCRVGERAFNEIRLANMGSTVIRCAWGKDVHSNHFNKEHYSTEHFIFNYSDRILLPHDLVILKVQFRADYPGFWREVWHLKTVPALGPGGSSDIPISLWARVLLDDNDCRRRELERQLDVLAIKRIVVNYRDQLLRNLPYRDHKTILRERFPVTDDIFMVDDVKLFEKANPGLSYHGHAMFTIVKLYRKVQRPSIHMDLMEGVRNVILDKYPRILQKEEESCKTLKTSKANFARKTSISTVSSTASRIAEEVDSRRVRLSTKSLQTTSRTHKVPKRTEVDSLLDGNFPLERRNITVKGLHKMIRDLDERLEVKNSMLMQLNQAVSDMSFYRDQSNVRNFKHIVCRTMLCQAAEDVAGIAQRLRHDMNLDLRTEKLGSETPSTGSNTTEVEMVTPEVEKRRLPPKLLNIKKKQIAKVDGTRNSGPYRQLQKDETDDITSMTSTIEIPPADSEVTGQRKMYRTVLSVLVYERVERLLLDLLPLMTCDDEPQPDPLKPWSQL